MGSALDLFHPLIREWFETNIGSPTPVQEQAWPVIAEGRHLLATAPTGSGKTLTAFLWAVNQLASGHWETGACRVLYISPLKALNNDIRENLIRPLAEIKARFEAAGLAFPNIRVLTRSGDTPQQERRKMSLHPPEILITTPESLNLLLSSKSGLLMLGRIKTVILDEIHACAATKRGTHLITAVDRLVRLSGEFQRIALSATLKDLNPIQRLVGGFRLSGPSKAPAYTARPVACIQAAMAKEIRIRVRFPEADNREDEGFSVWDHLAEVLVPRLSRNRSTLIFTNGRRLCEKLTYKLNEAAGGLVAFSHHGSLSRELRHDVEKKLKTGDLSAIVATSSLEMGIDIGSLDEVVMVQAPPSVSSAVQRLGRAGHRVGEASLGTIFPAHPQDILFSAVLARAAAEGDIEPLTPVDGPLDVLAQILISMTGMESWDLDELFAFIRTSAPFHTLSRERFDLVVNMLAGRYAGTRIRDLAPRIYVDRLSNRAEGAKGALLALYMSSGTIPDRGYFKLRHAQTRARIGELDEEYVWEAKKGQIATVGSRNWRITEITHNDVFALPVGNAGMDAPFWLAEAMNRDFHFSRRIGAFLETAAGCLDRGKAGEQALAELLRSEYCLDEPGASALIAFCRSQVRAAALPHARRLVLEYVRTGPGKSPGTMLVIHTLWGGRVNRPFALALSAAWERAFGERPEVFPGNDAVVIQLPGPLAPEEIMAWVRPDNLDELVRARLETSGFFGARFRECAGRALLITRNRAGQRMPLWMTRLRSQKLLENVLAFPDFPILLETWRTCLSDEFDLTALAECLARIETGEIAWEAVHTATPSPFAATLAWQQINQYMYREDQPAGRTSNLASDLIREALYNDALRPRIPKALIREFERKRLRLAEGYAPGSAAALLDWARERVVLPLDEWRTLAASLPDEDSPEIFSKVVVIRPEAAATPLAAALENARDILDAWYPRGAQILDLAGRPYPSPLPGAVENEGERPPAASLLGQWLGFYGPVTREWVGKSLGLPEDVLDSLFFDLTDGRQTVSGALVLEEDGEFVCDAGNFEILIRMNRAAARPGFSPLELTRLPLFLARIQGLTPPADGQDRLFDVFEQLSCLPLPPDLWETQVLPARIRPYYPAFLDSLMQEGELVWLGGERRLVRFCLAGDLMFLTDDDTPGPDSGHPLDAAVPGQKYGFEGLKTLTAASAAALVDSIWEAVWEGTLTNDTVTALRQGIEHGFRSPGTLAAAAAEPAVDSRWAGIAGRGRESDRSGFRSRTGARSRGFSRGRTRRNPAPLAGNWFRPEFEAAGDLVERQELDRDRVRLLLDRYGILFRELLERESSMFRWAAVFKSLYLMELAGEVVAGSFFKEIQGPQFASHKALRRLQAGGDDDAVFWINATDPASACGLGPLSAKLGLPRRLPGNAMVYKGQDLKLSCLRQGRELIIHAEPDDPELSRFLSPLADMMTRQYRPVPRITVATINGRDAVSSPYRLGLEGIFDVAAGPKTIDLFLKTAGS